MAHWDSVKFIQHNCHDQEEVKTAKLTRFIIAGLLNQKDLIKVFDEIQDDEKFFVMFNKYENFIYSKEYRDETYECLDILSKRKYKIVL